MSDRDVTTSPRLEARPLRTDELDYGLPEQFIATRPAEPRDSARLLVVRCSRDELEHRLVRDLPEYLEPGDALVFNNTAVAPARLFGRRVDTGGRVEGLFLEELDEQCWRLMLKSNGKLRKGQRIELINQGGQGSGHCLRLIERDGAEWIAGVEDHESAPGVLDEVGLTPLPPYIIRARGARNVHIDDARDRQWYQTVYADEANRKSVAAPTAGLHFTQELLKAIDARGVRRLDVTLNVGSGTFKPITTETIDEHEMHTEWCETPPATLEALRDREDGSLRRVLAVGTTTVRTLESLPDPLPSDGGKAISGETAMLISPPYKFKQVNGMLTNFHLPRSTLLALVGAMVGLDRLLDIYREAVQLEYRFYSYGDAMLILP